MRARAFAFIVAAAAAVAGCTTDTTANPSLPSVTGAASTTTEAGTPSQWLVPASWTAPPAAPSGPAPKVTHPLDASKFVASPCGSLTTADVTGLGIVDATAHADSVRGGPFCSWFHDSGNNTIPPGPRVVWMTGDTGGLSDVYFEQAQRGGAHSVYWSETTVAGYPAVYSQSTFTQFGENQICGLNVGVTDHLYFIAQYFSVTSWPDACAKANQIGLDVIKNLRG